MTELAILGRERSAALDVVRVLACVMVVCVHCPECSPSSLAAHEDYSILGGMILFVFGPCIGLFFMTSGALLLKPRPIAGNRAWLSRHLMRLIWPLLIWTAVYLCVGPLFGREAPGWHNLLWLPFSPQGNGHFWFLYVLVGIYLLVPVLNTWLASASRRIIEGYLCLWGVTLCEPFLGQYVGISSGTNNMLYYFTGYLGYFLLGYYLRAYRDALPLRRWWPVILVMVLSPGIVRVLHVDFDMSTLYGYLTLPVVAMCVMWWQIVMNTCRRLRATRWLMTLSSLTFGVYLVHGMVMSALKCTVFSPECPIMNYRLKLVLFVLTVAVISWLISWALSWLPGADKIVGYSSRLRVKKP